MVYCVHIELFPEAPREVREFLTYKQAYSFAFNKRRSLKGEFYAIRITHGNDLYREIELMIGDIYRSVHGKDT